jgi:hypothetical protein
VATGQPGVSFAPVVLGPTAVPWITDPDEAARTPELAVLSSVTHGHEPGGARVALAAIAAAVRLDAEPARLYHDLVMRYLGAAVRAELEALMATGKYEYQSEFARKYIAEGEARGEARGKLEGKAEGRLEGKVESLLGVLVGRGLAPSEAQRQRILGCRDLATLDRWLQRAVSATSVDDALI